MRKQMQQRGYQGRQNWELGFLRERKLQFCHLNKGKQPKVSTFYLAMSWVEELRRKLQFWVLVTCWLLMPEEEKGREVKKRKIKAYKGRAKAGRIQDTMSMWSVTEHSLRRPNLFDGDRSAGSKGNEERSGTRKILSAWQHQGISSLKVIILGQQDTFSVITYAYMITMMPLSRSGRSQVFIRGRQTRRHISEREEAIHRWPFSVPYSQCYGKCAVETLRRKFR